MQDLTEIRDVNKFKNSLTSILKQGMQSIALCFDECLVKLNRLGSKQNSVYDCKMKEVNTVFNTIVASYYKNRLLAILPDLAFTLETTRFSKGAIIVANYQKSKYKFMLREGIEAFRRNLTSYYVDQCKSHVFIFFPLDKLFEKEKLHTSHLLKVTLLVYKILAKSNSILLHVIQNYISVPKISNFPFFLSLAQTDKHLKECSFSLVFPIIYFLIKLYNFFSGLSNFS